MQQSRSNISIQIHKGLRAMLYDTQHSVSSRRIFSYRKNSCFHTIQQLEKVLAALTNMQIMARMNASCCGCPKHARLLVEELESEAIRN